jgi:hypothetical protein
VYVAVCSGVAAARPRAAALGVDDDDVLQADPVGRVVDVEEREALAHRADLLELDGVVDDDQLDAGVDVGVADLLGQQRGVDRDGLQSDGQAGEVAGDPVLRRLAQQADHVVVIEVDGGEDPGGDRVGTVGEVPPRAVRPRRPHLRADGGVSGCCGCAVVEEFCECVDARGHGDPSDSCRAVHGEGDHLPVPQLMWAAV